MLLPKPVGSIANGSFFRLIKVEQTQLLLESEGLYVWEFFKTLGDRVDLFLSFAPRVNQNDDESVDVNCQN